MDQTKHHVPTIATARLTLRPLRDDDADQITACLQDWSVVKNLARIPWPYGLKDAETYINERRNSDSEIAFAIDDGGLCGVIGLRDKEDGRAVIGYWLGRHAWGRGYATEAVQQIVDHGFSKMRFQSIEAGILPTNRPSMRVLEKAGFRAAGQGICQTIVHGDVDSQIYRLHRTDWADR